MVQFSSNKTLFFKVFLPIFWIVFFGAASLSTFFVEQEYVGEIPIFAFRIISLAFFALGAYFLIRYFVSLKRVELDSEALVVTNYFKAYKYKIEDLESIVIWDFLLLKFAGLNFKSKTSFGQQIRCLTSTRRLNKVLEAHPSIARKFEE